MLILYIISPVDIISIGNGESLWTTEMEATNNLSNRGIRYRWLLGITFVFFACHVSYTVLALTLPSIQLLGSLLIAVSIPVSALFGCVLPLRGFNSRFLIKSVFSIFVGIVAAYATAQLAESGNLSMRAMLCGHLALNLTIYTLMCGLTTIYIRRQQTGCTRRPETTEDQQLDDNQ